MADNGLLARYDVRISFDGPALVAHEIDAEVFASSLQAHAKLIKEISRITIGPEVDAKVKVKTIEKNGVATELVVQFLQNHQGTIHYLANNELTLLIGDIMTIAGYTVKPLFYTGCSVYAFMRWLKKRKIKNATPKGDDMMEVLLEDGTVETIKKNLYFAVVNDFVRRFLNSAIAPLRQHGIDVMRNGIRYPGGKLIETNVISKDELPLFTSFLQNDEETAVDTTVIGELDRPSFTGNPRGWKLVIPNHPTRTMTIKDKDFLELVDSKAINILKGDKFEVHLRETKTFDKNGKPRFKNEAILVRPVKPFD